MNDKWRLFCNFLTLRVRLLNMRDFLMLIDVIGVPREHDPYVLNLFSDELGDPGREMRHLWFVLVQQDSTSNGRGRVERYNLATTVGEGHASVINLQRVEKQ